MMPHRNFCTLWLLLLICVAGSAMKFNLFRKMPDSQEGNVRLFGTKTASEGRVEVYHEGKWGTVCDDDWDIAEAQVVCRQLHFPGAKSVVIGKEYGEASGPIWLDDMDCKGTENHLTSCAFRGWGVTDCSHKEDVGVICETADTNLTSVDSLHQLDHIISLSDELGQIFDIGNGCDFLILVQSPTGNRLDDGSPEMVVSRLCTHKLILSHFLLFNATEGTSSITVNVSQSCQPHFTSFIRYIYTRKMEVTFSSVQCLHWMASKFGVKQLMEDTGRLFSKVLPDDPSFHTQVSMYEYAVETGDLVLQENCIQYLAWNYQNLARSPAWTSLSADLMRALLLRSDLVVPDEYFLLQTLESWIKEKGSSASFETQVDLLGRIRFPMFPAEKLYELEFSSSLYSTHKNMYHENMLKAFQFNVLLFSSLSSNPKFNKNDDGYQPRIYTAEPWSTLVDPLKETPKPAPVQTSYYNSHRRVDRLRSYGPLHYIYPTVIPAIANMFSTPLHSSLIFKDNKIHWEANVFKSRDECRHKGLTCDSLPVARLASVTQQSNVLFHNRLLLMCQGKYVCQVHDFKVNLAHFTVNGTHVVSYPCPDDQYTYRFVVRPMYV